MQDNKKAIGYYIGHIVDQDIRYRASSGGIGTAIVKYLFFISRIQNVCYILF